MNSVEICRPPCHSTILHIRFYFLCASLYLHLFDGALFSKGQRDFSNKEKIRAFLGFFKRKIIGGEHLLLLLTVEKKKYYNF